MRTRSLIFLALLVTLSGCIVTYRDFPIVDPLPSPYEPAAPSRCRQTVKLSGGLAKHTALQLQQLSAALQEALKTYGGCSNSSPVDFTSKGAETEVVVSVLEKLCPWYYEIPGLISFLSTGIFPYYCGQSGWALSYSVYDRNALNKTYTYDITSKEFVWLFVVPFTWINFFTYSLEDAVRSTTAQFVVDAQRDGYLGTKN